MSNGIRNTKLYLLCAEEIRDPKYFESWKEYLPKERWERTVRPIREEDRKTELAAWLLVYYALKDWGIPEKEINIEASYCYGEHGKPMRKDNEVFFNLSHSGKYVLCAVSESETGCDIEKLRKVNWKLAKRFFSEKEYDYLDRLNKNEGKKSSEKTLYTSEEIFTRFWVLRESYVKKTGEGLGAALSGLDFSDISNYNNPQGKKNGQFLKETFFEMEYDGYQIALCEEKGSKPEFIVCRGTIDNCFL